MIFIDFMIQKIIQNSKKHELKQLKKIKYD